MPDVLTTAIIPADSAAVWALVRDFNGLPAWHPAIAGSELETSTDSVGAIRRLTLGGDGGEVREVLVSLDDTTRSLTYEILDSPFPVRLYRSTIRVTPVTTTGETFVDWRVVFDCTDDDPHGWARFFDEQVFAAGLDGLARYIRPTHG